jgi:hypothetical protein
MSPPHSGVVLKTKVRSLVVATQVRRKLTVVARLILLRICAADALVMVVMDQYTRRHNKLTLLDRLYCNQFVHFRFLA